ncbi:hypothetical protein CO665_34640 [Rhizobium anhuiense]|nr:hypothetical protein CO665_34640 [Rhizobium anhuiense]
MEAPQVSIASEIEEFKLKGKFTSLTLVETAKWLSSLFDKCVYVDAEVFRVGDTWSMSVVRLAGGLRAFTGAGRGRSGTVYVREITIDKKATETNKVRVELVPTELFPHLDDRLCSYVKMTNEQRLEAIEVFRLADGAEKMKLHRKVASAAGGKALVGTIRQKIWAEELRSNFLKSVTPEFRERVLKAQPSQSAKWWIENRTKLLSAASSLNTPF